MRHVLVEALLGLLRFVDAPSRHVPGNGGKQGADYAYEHEGCVDACYERLFGRDVDIGDVICAFSGRIFMPPVASGNLIVISAVGIDVVCLVVACGFYRGITSPVSKGNPVHNPCLGMGGKPCGQGFLIFIGPVAIGCVDLVRRIHEEVIRRASGVHGVFVEAE